MTGSAVGRWEFCCRGHISLDKGRGLGRGSCQIDLCPRLVDFSSGSKLAFFSSVFLNIVLTTIFRDFSSILEGFWQAWEVPKSFFGAFFGDYFRSLILESFFSQFFTVFSMLESLKIVLLSRRELNFYNIVFLAPDRKKQVNLVKKPLDFQVENREKLIMGGFRKSSIFRHRFSMDLGRFWEGFWEAWEVPKSFLVRFFEVIFETSFWKVFFHDFYCFFNA